MVRIACVVAVLLGCQQGSGPPRAQSDVVGAAPVSVRPSPPFDVPAPADPVIAISRGEQHACVVHASGAVDCWGQPKWCPTCFKPAPPDSHTRRITGITDAVAISPKGHCFVRRTGEVACMDLTTGALVPRPDVTHVRATTDDDCVLLESGGVRCDGLGHFEPIKDMHDAIAIAEGGHVTCVIRKAGTLACQFGEGEFMRVGGVDGVRAVAISSRRLDTQALVCVLATTPRCFFLDTLAYDQPLIEPLPESFNVPKLDPTVFASATQIAVAATHGEMFEVEALVGGKVLIADDHGTRTVPLLSDATQLTAGCAVRRTGAVACWGENYGGVLGQPTTAGRVDVPATPVPGVANIASVVAGHTETWALTRDGRVLHWGVNETQHELTPTQMQLGDSFDTEPIADLLVERSALCARGTLGHVWCELRGNQYRGVHKLPTSGVTRMEVTYDRLDLYHADGSVDWVEEPFGVPPEHLEHFKNPNTTIKTIQLGQSSCWQFADGRVTCEHTPMPQLTGATALAGSGHVGCGIVEKRVMCWTEGKTDVHTIESIGSATDLQLGYDFACAVVDGGRVVCWHLDDQKPPVQVIASGAASLGLGDGYRARYQEVNTSSHDPPMSGDYGCAVMLDHTVQCWGANFFGELLDDSLLSSETPIGIRL